MTTAITTASTDVDAVLALVIAGDMSRLSGEQKIAYYRARCEAAGLDPRAQPFQYMRLQGKETLYATKAATDQLSALHGIRVEILSQATDEGVRVVTVKATARDGRETVDIGAVPVKGLSGENLANAYMKALTKAKRRAVLSICGLGMLDETEVETIPAAAKLEVVPAPAPLEDNTARLGAAIAAKVEQQVEAAKIPDEAASVLLAISVAASRQDLNRLGKEIHKLPTPELQAQAREAFNARSKEIG